MNKVALGQLFYQELEKIGHRELAATPKLEALYRLLNLVVVEATRKERLQFSTLFSRIVYASQNYHLDKLLQIQVHRFRKGAQETLFKGKTDDVELLVEAGMFVIARLIVSIFEVAIPDVLKSLMQKEFPLPFSDVAVAEFRASTKVLAIAEDRAEEQLIVQDEDHPEAKIRVQYNIPERNENFNPTIWSIRKVFGFPVTLNLLDVEIDEAGVYRPRAFVVEPDYLMDVSVTANCFNDWGAEPLLYLLRKYLPVPANKHIMLGNIANFFLDELMSNPERSFRTIFPKVLTLNPLAFCLFEDSEIRTIQQIAQRHYVVLKRMVMRDFREEGIAPEYCFLEPSFFSEQYGLQGRLDVLFRHENRAAIIELKSGKTYKPNQYGISHAHFTQTLLYDLMIRSVFGKGIDPKNYILYSSSMQQSLRFAPRVKAQQYEALQIRNQLVAIDWELKDLTKWVSQKGMTDLVLERPILFSKLSSNRFAHVKGFLAEDIALFEKIYKSLSKLERKYFNAFSGFIAREHQLSKTGVEGIDGMNGLAALWRKAFEEKNEQFEILSYLIINNNQSKAEQPTIQFERTERTHPLANFRKGDIVVLYPIEEVPSTRSAILNHQIFKCTIVDLDQRQVKVQLRSQQFNTSIFEKYKNWNLEHDMMDSSFLGLYRGLFQFAQQPVHKRDLLLAKRPPRKSEPLTIDAPPELTEEQQAIFRKALAAEEYFLLWGPPGTGKTSMMLKYLVAHLLKNTDEHLILMAYTNRAVDEICEAIERIDKTIRTQYFRIGSRFSTDKRFQPQLLQSKIADAKSRDAIKAILKQHRIVVGTVSSIANKPELLQLKIFHTAIIDEASQLLEPTIIGLLPHFKRFILIGDHKQLPAVVLQDEAESRVRDEDLNSIGLGNLRNSLFERFYHQCRNNGWHWAYAQLSHQGRMHQNIMQFPNEHFYQRTLKILPASIAHSLKQQTAIELDSHSQLNQSLKQLLQHRILFLPSPVDENSLTKKTNKQEALLIQSLLAQIHAYYQEQKKPFTPQTIGIITPYRAQIAQIREVLQELKFDIDLITIDTVERYQGGARDIIIISLCTNTIHQMDTLVSRSDEGVDRRLNVALTRAKEHLVIIGNPEILRTNETYRALMKQFQHLPN